MPSDLIERIYPLTKGPEECKKLLTILSTRREKWLFAANGSAMDEEKQEMVAAKKTVIQVVRPLTPYLEKVRN